MVLGVFSVLCVLCHVWKIFLRAKDFSCPLRTDKEHWGNCDFSEKATKLSFNMLYLKIHLAYTPPLTSQLFFSKTQKNFV